MKRTALIAACVCSFLFAISALSPEAWAQKRKPHKLPPGAIPDENFGETDWAETPVGAIARAHADDKPVLLYCFPPGSELPSFFNSGDMRKASREDAVFCKLKFDREDKVFAKLKIEKVPVILGLDKYGNEYVRSSSITISVARSVIDDLPKMVNAFEEKIYLQHDKALQLLDKGDEKGAIKLFVDIVASGKRGYDRIERSASKLEKLTEKEFKELATLAETDKSLAKTNLTDASKKYKGTPQGAYAEIMLATLENEDGDAKSAIRRLLPIAESDHPFFEKAASKAKDALEHISNEGVVLIDKAKKSGDKAKAAETIRKIAKDYEGTDAAAKAKEALK